MLEMILDSVKLCVPVSNPDGLNSKVSQHFGRAPYHIAVDVNTGIVETIRKGNECSEETHGHCVPVDLLLENDIKMVACKGLGKGALARLVENKIAVFSTEAETVEDVIRSYTAKQLQLVSDKNICQGHHH